MVGHGWKASSGRKGQDGKPRPITIKDNGKIVPREDPNVNKDGSKKQK